MGVNEKQNFSSKFSLDIFKDTFQLLEPDVTITAFEEAKGSGKGDNYTATLYRIHLKGHYKTNDDDNKIKYWEKSVICKRLPDNDVMREAYKSDQLFRNEVEFYISIMPELIKFQKSKTNDIFKAMPQCYSAHDDLLIMEDLQSRDFQMANRQKGLSIDETQSVLKEVAKLHSLGFAYKIQYPKQFDNLKSLIQEGIFCKTNEDWYRKYYNQLTKNAINMISDVLPENSKYLNRLIDFIGNPEFFSRMIELVSKESILSTICHGDCWINNFLYKYDETGKVIETSIVDFQLIRYGSPVLDISNVIYCCTTKSIRDEHFNSFIDLYINEFYKSIETLIPNQLPDYCNTEIKCKELFLDELKEYGKFALGVSLDIIPISTCSPEDAPDLYIGRPSTVDEPDCAPLLNFPPNDLCRQKMSELLIDLIDGGML